MNGVFPYMVNIAIYNPNYKEDSKRKENWRYAVSQVKFPTSEDASRYVAFLRKHYSPLYDCKIVENKLKNYVIETALKEDNHTMTEYFFKREFLEEFL